MSNSKRSITIMLVLALASVACCATASARAIGGKTYLGGIPATGLRFENHRYVQNHAGGLISLRVSRNGASVLVRFTSAKPVLYCYTTKTLHVQSGGSARISSSGAFKASVAERFSAGPGLPPIVQVITGRFSGRVVEGRIETQAAECSGRTTFYATAQ